MGCGNSQAEPTVKQKSKSKLTRQGTAASPPPPSILKRPPPSATTASSHAEQRLETPYDYTQYQNGEPVLRPSTTDRKVPTFLFQPPSNPDPDDLNTLINPTRSMSKMSTGRGSSVTGGRTHPMSTTVESSSNNQPASDQYIAPSSVSSNLLEKAPNIRIKRLVPMSHDDWVRNDHSDTLTIVQHNMSRGASFEVGREWYKTGDQ